MKLFPITRQRPNTLLYYILCISLLFFTSACTNSDHSSSGTGSISFSVEWRGAPTIKDASGLAITRALDCVDYGIVSVEAHIFDENGSYLTAGGPWLCSAHAGTIENVPEGLNRRVVVSGKDSNDNLLYSGEVTGITVTTGQTTNAGTIVVNPVNTAPTSPTNVSATAGNGQVTISWDSVSGATSYKIYWATWSEVSKTSYEGITSPDTSINPDTTVFESVLSYNGNIYALTKDDILTWEEADTLSNQHDGYIATINDAQENAFLTQNYLSLIYKELWIGYNDRNNEGTWVWANGETSTYTNWGPEDLNEDEDCVIIRDTEGYWDDAPCIWGRSAIVEWETETSYTHTGLTNGTTYYYVVTAVNDYGESDESSEVNTTPSSTSSAYTNSLGMSFQLIPAGTFTMGSPSDEAGRDDDETQHQVTLTQFYIQTTEVTQAQWIAVMGSNPSSFSGCSDCPVEQVSWNNVQTFITNLNNQGEGTYRLPTEAEWEYAARAGSTTAFANGDITYYADMIECKYDSNLDAMGWYCYNSSSITHSVGQKDPNAWGLYDMHGNVYEWCEDWYGTYPLSSVTDPTGPLSGSYRVFRGAGWWNYARYCRSAYRSGETPDYIGNVLGFRLVLTASKVPDTGQTTSYTTTFGEDSDYEINLPSYTDNGSGTITDNVTGLIWQKEDDDITRVWDDAVSYCNDLSLASYSDWRLSSKKELMSIVDYGTYSPSIDATDFSATNASKYWSSTTLASNSSYAWPVHFSDGSVDDGYIKTYSYYVRCVRGQELNFGNFTDNGNGTVMDNSTGLMWQQGEGGQKTWEDALTYCEDLSLGGHVNWRLPNIKELDSINDDTVYSPAIDTNFFPDAIASAYWSSTTDANYSSTAFRVYFSNGSVYSGNKSSSYYVRCVRGGQ